MSQNNEWFSPHYKNQIYYDKPVTFFWLAAAVEKLTHCRELAGRLPAVISGILAVLTTYALGRRMFGTTAGFLAGLILATSGEFLFIARWYRMDMPFEAAMWAAIWWFWRAEDIFCRTISDNNAPRPHYRKTGWYGFYIFCAIATLFKGPAGLLLPALCIAAYFVLSRQPRRIFEMFHIGGILAYLAITTALFLTIGLREPNYFYEFFIRQNVERFTNHTFGKHSFPGILYIPILMGGILPWTVYLPTAVIKYFPRRWQLRNQEPEVLFLWTTALLPLIFFSFSKTKMVNYILPIFPPLTILLGRMIADWISQHKPDIDMKRAAWGLSAILSICMFAAVGFDIWQKNCDLWLAIPISAGLVCALLMPIWIRRDKRNLFVGCTGTVTCLLYLFLIGHAGTVCYDRLSTRKLAQLIDPGQTVSAQFCCWGETKVSFAYYIGISEAKRFKHSVPKDFLELTSLLKSDQTIYCLVTGPREMDMLKKNCPDAFCVLGYNNNDWLITNRKYH